MISVILLGASALAISCAFGAEYDLTVEIESGKIQCYYQPVVDNSHVAMEIDYQVIEGGDMDISFRVTSPTGKLLVVDVRRMDNTRRFNITEEKGDYELCFDNSFSSQRKLVFFQLLLEDEAGNSDDLEYEKLASNFAIEVQETMDQIRETCIKIKTNLNKAETNQAVLRAAEARDRSMMESSSERVTVWSLVGSVIMVTVGVIQVFTLKTLFNEKSTIGQAIRGSRN